MRALIKRHLRNLQSFLPWLRPLKFGYYNLAARRLGWHIDPHFRILEHLPDVTSAIDVGGNWGQSIHTIRRLRPEAQVTSFEPNPFLAERLAAMFRHDDHVQVRPCALSSQSGVMTLHIPSYRGFIYDGLAALDRDKAEGWLNACSVAHFDRSKLSVRSCEVAVECLDHSGLDPDFIKIDVQGHELAVLKGARNILGRSPVVLLEAASLEIVRYLLQFGLKPYRFNGRQLIVPFASGNALFMTDERVERTGLGVVQMFRQAA